MSYARGGQGGNRSSNRGGGSYRGGSYARGRGRNARRDSMGRYSSGGGYSRAEDFRDMLEEAMESAPNEQTREKLRRLMLDM